MGSAGISRLFAHARAQVTLGWICFHPEASKFHLIRKVALENAVRPAFFFFCGRRRIRVLGKLARSTDSEPTSTHTAVCTLARLRVLKIKKKEHASDLPGGSPSGSRGPTSSRQLFWASHGLAAVALFIVTISATFTLVGPRSNLVVYYGNIQSTSFISFDVNFRHLASRWRLVFQGPIW